MVFAQMTSRDGLRDIATCLNARTETLYHLGFTEPVAKSTLADANETRDWRIWEDLAKSLMKKARPLYAGEDLGLDLNNTIYALDSTTIDLSLTLFPWADFRQTKAGIKLHTQIDLRGPIPTCICITGARQHDVGWLDSLFFEAGAFYLMDRGYMDFSRLILIANAGAFFVTRAKSNLRVHSALLEARGSFHRPAQRSCWKTHIDQIPKCLSRFVAQGEILRFGNQQGTHLSDQQLGNTRPDRRHALQGAMEYRVVLPLDQRTSAHQALLRHKSQRGENANLDCRVHLSDNRNPPQAAQAARHAPQNFAAFECSSVRESHSK